MNSLRTCLIFWGITVALFFQGIALDQAFAAGFTTPPRTKAVLGASPQRNQSMAGAKRGRSGPPSVEHDRDKRRIPEPGVEIISGDHVPLTRVLGRGAFAQAYVTPLKGGVPVVVKELKRFDFRATERELAQQTRAAELGSAPKPIGKVFCIKREAEYSEADKASYAFAMEYIPDAVTFRTAAESICREEPARRQVLLQTMFARGLATLDVIHRASLYHRDIAPSNMLCIPTGRDLDMYEVKLIDFGEEDAGQARYHCDTSLESPHKLDLIAYILAYLEVVGEYNANDYVEVKITVPQILEKIRSSVNFSDLTRDELISRLQAMLSVPRVAALEGLHAEPHS